MATQRFPSRMLFGGVAGNQFVYDAATARAHGQETSVRQILPTYGRRKGKEITKSGQVRGRRFRRPTSAVKVARIGPLFIALKDPKTKPYRNVKGQYLNMTDLHMKYARTMSEAMALELDKTLYRPGVSTGRLKASILDPRNRTADKLGFGVGIPEWLDISPAAPYWRSIEEGTSFFLGRRLVGVWGSTIESLTGGRGKFGPYPLAGPTFSGFGQGAGQRFRPMSAPGTADIMREMIVAHREAVTKARRWHKKKPAKPTFAASIGKNVIKRPIRAEHYMLNGFRNWQTTTDYKRDVTKAVLRNVRDELRGE